MSLVAQSGSGSEQSVTQLSGTSSSQYSTRPLPETVLENPVNTNGETASPAIISDTNSKDSFKQITSPEPAA